MNIHEETLKIARNLIKKDPSLTDWVISKFPELKESEDEKMREMAIKAVYAPEAQSCIKSWGINPDDVIDWLKKQGKKESVTCPICGWEVEKQGEQKPTDKIQLGKKYKCIASPRYSTFTTGEIYKPEDEFLCNLMNLCSDCFEPIEDGEQKPNDKTEPKFKVGDWIVTDTQAVLFVDKIYEFDYCVIDTKNWLSYKYTIKIADEKCHLWAIQDAKDGDVLAVEPIEGYHSPFVAIYKKQNEEDFDSYCFIGFDGKFCKGENGHSTKDVYPATKEQRDTLMKAMADAGYTFDFEKKELKKIIDEKQIKKNLQDNSFRRMFEQKPAEWSEEDNRIRKAIIDNIQAICEEGYFVGNIDSNKLIDWLKDRIQPQQKQEWSKEDNLQLQAAIDICKSSGHTITSDWLKSLKNRIQPQVEWSKRDIHIITNIYDFVAENTIDINRRACANECLDWIKSLKYGFKPVLGWSEEDKETLDGVIDSLQRYNYNVPSMAVDKQILWLKSIKNRIDCEGTTIKKWKPSEKQLKELENVFSPDTDSWDENILRELYKQLKQL